MDECQILISVNHMVTRPSVEVLITRELLTNILFLLLSEKNYNAFYVLYLYLVSKYLFLSIFNSFVILSINLVKTCVNNLVIYLFEGCRRYS